MRKLTLTIFGPPEVYAVIGDLICKVGSSVDELLVSVGGIPPEGFWDTCKTLTKLKSLDVDVVPNIDPDTEGTDEPRYVYDRRAVPYIDLFYIAERMEHLESFKLEMRGTGF